MSGKFFVSKINFPCIACECGYNVTMFRIQLHRNWKYNRNKFQTCAEKCAREKRIELKREKHSGRTLTR